MTRACARNLRQKAPQIYLLWMPPVWNAADVPGYAWTELTFERASLDLEDREIADLFARLLAID
jgi:hypothetical protein